jgi:hypothetical protein
MTLEGRGGPMKLNLIETPITVDRLATSDEIRAAVLSSPDPLEEYRTEIVREIAADVGGYIRISAVEFETFRLIEEMIEEQDTWAD